MPSAPEQDLALFADHSILPDSFLKLRPSQLGIVGHAQGTSPAWLINALIENAISGTGSTVNRDMNRRIPNRSHVVYISFTHIQSFVVKNCRKNGLSLDSDKNFTFIDCFTDLFTKQITDPSDKKAVQKFLSSIESSVKNIDHDLKVVILENPEVLLAATSLETNQLVHFVLSLQALCNSIFVVIDAEPSLIDFECTMSDDAVSRFTDFYVKLLHKSSINVNLLPLVTGRAEDITGCLTISAGALPSPTSVAENQFIYNITKESNIKLYFR